MNNSESDWSEWRKQVETALDKIAEIAAQNWEAELAEPARDLQALIRLFPVETGRLKVAELVTEPQLLERSLLSPGLVSQLNPDKVMKWFREGQDPEKAVLIYQDLIPIDSLS
jgi:hypothetical protein